MLLTCTQQNGAELHPKESATSSSAEPLSLQKNKVQNE